MIVLEEKGFGGYKNKLVSFSNKEHKGEDVLKLNPRGQVGILFKNNAVLHYSYLALVLILNVSAGDCRGLVYDVGHV